MRKIFTHYHSLNKVGLWLSVLCTIHCLAMPFLMTALPFLGGSFLSEKSEIYMIGVSAILAIFLLSVETIILLNSLDFLATSIAYAIIGFPKKFIMFLFLILTLFDLAGIMQMLIVLLFFNIE